MDGSLLEVGPFKLHHDEKHFQLNNGSWHKYANLLFVDRPLGTEPFLTDTSSHIKELPDLAADLVKFLEKYFEIFPERQRDEFYIAGESYAGQYIPYLARAILDKNLQKTSPLMSLSSDKKTNSKSIDNNSKDKETWIDLKAVLIGNGWIDPATQYLSYLSFAYQTGLIKYGSSTAATVEKRHEECSQWYQRAKNHPSEKYDLSVGVCEDIVNTLLRELYNHSGLAHQDPNSCLNIYDIRLRDTYPSCGMSWPKDLVSAIPFFNRKEVLEALHISSSNSQKECSNFERFTFKTQKSRPSIELIPSLIEDNLQVIMFNGDQDLACNHLGNERLIRSLSWGPDAENSEPILENSDDFPGKAYKSGDGKTHASDVGVDGKNLQGNGQNRGFHKDEEAVDWYVDGSVVGEIQTGRNLTYLKIYNGSHMVPFDSPKVAQAMVYHFLNIPGFSSDDLVKGKSETSVHQESKPDYSLSEGEETTNVEENMIHNTNHSDTSEGQESWQPYYKAGAFVLVICILGSLFLGLFVWRNRKLSRSIRGPKYSQDPNRKHKRVRSVHYEDELDDFEAGRLRSFDDDDEDEPEGFLQSILSGMSRWHVPHNATRVFKLHELSDRKSKRKGNTENQATKRGGLKKSLRNPKYEQLGSLESGKGSSETEFGNRENVQLETFHDNRIEHEEGNTKALKAKYSLDQLFRNSDDENGYSTTSESINLV